MIIIWKEEKCETPWGIFEFGVCLDTLIMGIPDENAYDLINNGIVELIGESELPAEKWWDKEKKEIVPIAEKPKPEPIEKPKKT